MNSHVAIVLAHEEPFRIGDAVVRPQIRELEYDSRTTILEPRVMQVLVALHQANGHVVSRDDLVSSCWAGRIVGDDAIHRVISRLRHDAEQAGGQFRIETITKVGYRLVSDGDLPAGTLPTPDRRTGLDRRSGFDRRSILLGGGAFALAGAGGFLWYRDRDQMPPEAVAHMVQGRAAFRMGTMASAVVALSNFKAATELAPDHAEPWGALASAYAYQALLGPPSEVASAERNARASATRALSLDPDNGYALTANIRLDYANGAPLASIDRRVQIALQRASQNWALYNLATFFLNQVGRFKDALRTWEDWRRIESDLGPQPAAAHAYALYSAGREGEAEQMLSRLMDQWPRHSSVWFTLQKFLMFTRRHERALALIDDVARRPVGVPDSNFELTRIQTLGFADPARYREQALAETHKAARQGTGFAANSLLYFSAAGLRDDAFAIAEALYLRRGFNVPRQVFTSEQGQFQNKRQYTLYLFEPVTAPMRADPRFQPLIENLGLPQYWRTAGVKPDYLA